MQFLTKLAAYGQAFSRKQIAVVCGLIATASIGGFVLADYLTAPVGDVLSAVSMGHKKTAVANRPLPARSSRLVKAHLKT